MNKIFRIRIPDEGLRPVPEGMRCLMGTELLHKGGFYLGVLWLYHHSFFKKKKKCCTQTALTVSS